ncbi:MAG: hypothetical protein M3093_04395 [Thermoproteota archaeon]|nr:hypothetical protein [Thermoproteota archaeon]
MDNTNWFLAIITAILAAITGYYAWQTKKSVIALEESTKVQFKPFLKGSIAQIGPVSLELQITNIGKGSAEEITVSFGTREFTGSQRTWRTELLQPNEHQKFFIPIGERADAVQRDFNFFRDNQTTIDLNWRCRDILGNTHERSQTINVTNYVRQFENTRARYEQPPMEVISNALTDMKRDVGNIGKNLRSMSIDLTRWREMLMRRMMNNDNQNSSNDI